MSEEKYEVSLKKKSCIWE